MKTVYSSPNITLVYHFKNILEGCGISCQIRKEYLSSGAGELPPTDCWPELCVADEGLFANPTSATRAKKIGKLLILRSRIFKGRHYKLDFLVRR